MPAAKRYYCHTAGMRRLLLLSALSIVSTVLITQPALCASPEGIELFEKDIRPIFVERCQKCHGEKQQWSGLRLDSPEGAITGGDSGPAVVAEQPDESELLNRISDTDDDYRMPPPKEGPPLTAEQIHAVRQWIQLGAPWPESTSLKADDKKKLWREHWAFQPIKQVEPPRSDSKLENPIDRFVIEKLDAAGLQLSSEADRRALIQRATYDLTGLPPTPEAVAEFVDDDAPDAYEKLIDRLLASPRYGEQWGRYWLDIARYSDTKGYVYSREQRFFVHSSLYRDWIIRAFNDDMPYDRFVLLQIAADQAAPDDPEALAAMGFLTLGRRMLGVTPDIIEDRIDIVSRGLLGLTVGCARCHDHKFDPIPTADYYSLYGVFQNSVERQIDVAKSDRDADASKRFQTGLAKRRKKMAQDMAERRQETSDRVRSQILEYLLAQRDLDQYPDLSVIAVTTKEDVLPGFVRQWEAYLKEAALRNDPVFAAWTAYAKLPADQFASGAAAIAEQLPTDPERIHPKVAKAFATPPTSANEVAERYAKLFTDVYAAWIKLCADAKAAGLPHPEQLPNPEDEALRQVLYGADSPCEIPDEPIVNTEYLWDEPAVNKMWALQNDVDKWLLKYPHDLSCAVVLTDRSRIVDPQIFRRGNPMNRGETVPRQFLEAIAGSDRKPFQHGSGRLEMAQAIVDPANPLTARVWVNRVWLHHFGAGLVTTPSDFGVRSTPPSHPELLDWLAGELIEHGWSTKWLHRTIMLSAAYRQSSKPPMDAAELAIAQERDPDNRLLWRMNPRRLSFEQFRDSLLAVSGELDESMGGKGEDLFGGRRSVYTLVDRQYLPMVFNVFDFASPDFHSSQRSETTTPQQALFALNNSYLADRARKIAARVREEASTPEARAIRTYQIVLRRDPTPSEVLAATQFLTGAIDDSSSDRYIAEAKAWSYGYGEVDGKTGIVKSFRSLPHFTGKAWQGGPAWPDSALGWVQLTSRGGHTGNDHEHAAIRRWTASSPGLISIKSEIAHQEVPGDGVQCWIVANGKEVLESAQVHNKNEQLNVDSLFVEEGATIDFIVDYGENLNSDMFTWVPTITQEPPPTATGDLSNRPSVSWNSERNFPIVRLLPLEQLTQLLLISNEFMFVD